MMLSNPNQKRIDDKKLKKTNYILEFYTVINGKRSPNGSPFGSFSREK